MNHLKYATAFAALLAFAGTGWAQETVVPQTGTTPAVECPAPGSVPAADLPAGCPAEAQSGTSGTTTQTETVPAPDNSTSATGSVSDPAATTTAPTDAAATTTTMPATAMPGDMLASQFIGQTVYTSANESVGEINDLVMNKDLDNVIAIIGVGGFLGMGEKDVAIPVDQFTIARDENNALRLTIGSTKADLEAAPAFDRTALK